MIVRPLHTPGDERALAVGFVFSEGIISGLADIVTLRECELEPGTIAIQVCESPNAAPIERNTAVVSSCGLCGKRLDIESLLSSMPPVANSLHASLPLLLAVVERMRLDQVLFSHTGASHAAAIFQEQGQFLAMGEDLGRHTALDKAIGKCLLAGRPLSGCGAVLSGRVSLEIVAKCARAGLELIAAVSAPTSLAVQAARRWNLTLCGFVRDDRATVYTHPRRLRELRGNEPVV